MAQDVDKTTGYDAVLQYKTNNNIALPSGPMQAICREVVDSLIARGQYETLATYPGGGLWILATDGVGNLNQVGVNLVAPKKHRFEEINSTDLVPYKGWTSGGTGYLDNGYVFGRADTATLYNNWGVGGLYQNVTTDTTGNFTYGFLAKRAGVDKQLMGFGQIESIDQPRGFTAHGRTAGTRASLNRNAAPFLWYAYADNGVVYGSFNSSGAVPQTFDVEAGLEAYPGGFALGARKVYDYATAVSETPTSITVDAYMSDTLAGFFVGPADLTLKNSVYELLSIAAGKIAALNDTIDLFSQQEFYFNTHNNTALPAVPRSYYGYGHIATGGSGRDGSGVTPKLYAVTNSNFYGKGSLHAAIDSANNDGVPSTINIYVSGTADTTFFEQWLITEDDITISGQFVPTTSQGFRLQGVALNIKCNNYILEHFTIGAGDLPEEGIPYGTIVNSAGWTQFSERDCLSLSGDTGLVRHMTFNFSTDELVQTRGSHISIEYCLFADPLAFAEIRDGIKVGHHKGKHAKGLLGLRQGNGEGENNLIYRNCFIGTSDRMPQVGSQWKGVIQENYAFGGKYGIATVYGKPYTEDTLEGGYPVATIRRNFIDLITTPAYMRPYPKGFTNAGLLYYDSNFVNGTYTFFEAQEPTHRAVDPIYELPGSVFVPSYKARKFYTFFSGAGPFYADTLVQLQKQKAYNKTVLPPPNNMNEVGNLVYLPDTSVTRTLPANPFAIAPSGYTNLEEMADSLHWVRTYGPNVTYPGIEPLSP